MTLFTSCGESPKTNSEEINFKEELAIPEFTIYTLKDSTEFHSKKLPKKGIVLVKYFSPDCEHCQKEIQTYISKKDSLSNIQTIWITGTWVNLETIKNFSTQYQLDELDPIAIGKENMDDIISYYGMKYVPYTAIYLDNQLIKDYRGSLDFKELINMNEGKYVQEPKDSILKRFLTNSGKTKNL